jgi:hypothetical protein
VQLHLRLFVMALHPEGDGDQNAGDEQRHPAAFKKFHHAQGNQDAAGEQQAEAVDAHFALPLGLARAVQPPVPHHAELGEAEGDEDVDAVEHHDGVHGGPGEVHHQKGRERPS